MFRISKANGRQASELAKIHATGFPLPWDQAAIRGFVEDKTVLSFLALQPPGPDILGFVMTRFVAGEADILTLAVTPELQNRGVGYGLCHATLRCLSGQGIKKVHLEVSTENLRAIRLYQKVGFERVGVRPKYYGARQGGQREDALRMSLDIQTAKFQFEPVSYLVDQF